MLGSYARVCLKRTPPQIRLLRLYHVILVGGNRDRGKNVQLSSELRTFLAFRSNANIENVRAIWDVVRGKLELIKRSENLYTLEQEVVSHFKY